MDGLPTTLGKPFQKALERYCRVEPPLPDVTEWQGKVKVGEFSHLAHKNRLSPLRDEDIGDIGMTLLQPRLRKEELQVGCCPAFSLLFHGPESRGAEIPTCGKEDLRHQQLSFRKMFACAV